MSRAPPAIPTRHATTTATRPAVPAAVPSGPGLSIKGKSGKTVVEVANLAQGTSAEDVKVCRRLPLARRALLRTSTQTLLVTDDFRELWRGRGRSGNAGDSRGCLGSFLPDLPHVARRDASAILIRRSPSLHQVQVEFKFASSAHKAVEAFNNQLADGRVLSVSIKEIPPPPPPPAGPRATAPASRSTAAVPAAPSGSALFSRLGLPAITKAGGAAPPPASGARSATGGGGDLMDGFGSASFVALSHASPLRNISLTTMSASPHRKMYSDSLANSGAAPSSSGRGFGGRGGGRRRATAAGSMDID